MPLADSVPPASLPGTMAPQPVGAVRLFSAFLREQSDPDYFYGMLARDSVALVERHVALENTRVVDVGGGAGYFAEAFRARGAACLLVEPDAGELKARGKPGPASVVGDGYWLPLADASVDIAFSCNVLEHVRDPEGLIDEMIRVTRPGGLIYLSYTVWLGPWGGHETSPWHYLGGSYARRRYTRKHGHEPKNVYGESMFGLSVARILSFARGRADTTVIEARPRYYPRWCRFLLAVPGLRELLTWNLLLILRRQS